MAWLTSEFLQITFVPLVILLDIQDICSLETLEAKYACSLLAPSCGIGTNGPIWIFCRHLILRAISFNPFWNVWLKCERRSFHSKITEEWHGRMEWLWKYIYRYKNKIIFYKVSLQESAAFSYLSDSSDTFRGRRTVPVACQVLGVAKEI